MHPNSWLEREALIDEAYVYDETPFASDVFGEPDESEVAEMFAFLEAELSGEWTPTASVDRIVSIRSRMSQLLAQEQRELARLWEHAQSELPEKASSTERDLAGRSLIAELAVALRVADQTMSGRLSEAYSLVNKYPATLDALEAGTIGIGHVRTIVEFGCAIDLDDAEARALYEASVLERAVHVTPGRLRRVAQLAAARLGKVPFEERHRVAKAERRVAVTELDNGMSEIFHIVPTVLAAGIWDRLTEQAKAVKNSGDVRTLDQIRADLAAELLLTGEPSGDEDAPHRAGIGIRGEVSIVIPMLTLLGKDDEPATLAGRGPIDLETARQLAADAPSLTRILTDPVTDMVLTVDTYRPSKQLRRYLRQRDGRCRFPTCNRNARRCDIDHTIDRQYGGLTEPGNLAVLCRGHHTLKHQTPWKVKQTSPGILEWTSPLGRVTIDRPDTPVRFD